MYEAASLGHQIMQRRMQSEGSQNMRPIPTVDLTATAGREAHKISDETVYLSTFPFLKRIINRIHPI